MKNEPTRRGKRRVVFCTKTGCPVRCGYWAAPDRYVLATSMNAEMTLRT